MMRRFTPSVAVSRQTRSYTDYHHHTYPQIKTITVGVPIGIMAYWFVFLFWGSNLYEKNRVYKKNLLRSWKRRMGTGYGWAEDFGPTKEHVFKNLPTSAE
jgi:hypothetical protein